jgi:CRP-like cAMP-binding protein/formamidopyrimidine-DNA glycosylase
MAEGDTIHRNAARIAAALGDEPLVEASAPNPRSPLRLQVDRLRSLTGRRLERADAHGKHLFLRFEGALTLHSHQGVSGSWHVHARSAGHGRPLGGAWVVLATETAVAAEFGGPRLALRTEGELRADPRLRRLGPDILAAEFEPRLGVAAIRAADQGRQLGELLLDQRVVAGIGNVYKCEACFAAAADPWLPVGRLSDETLYAVLEEAARMMEAGRRSRRRPHRVYRKSGRSCARCGARIRSHGQGDQNRITYWCPGCQASEAGGPGADRQQPFHPAESNNHHMGVESTDLLARVPLFSELSRAELEQISSVAVPRSFPKGVRVFHEGDTSDACYIVREGDLRVTREHSDGRAIALATLGRGDIFGELAMLDGGSRSASVETLTDSELLALPASDVRRVIATHGDIAAKLIVALTRRLRETNERVARQSFQTVPSRVAGVLNQLIAEEAIPEDREGITVRMTQADLAQLAGTSRESVSRFLATLERAGVVQVGRGRVTVVEPRRLRAYIF